MLASVHSGEIFREFGRSGGGFVSGFRFALVGCTLLVASAAGQTPIPTTGTPSEIEERVRAFAVERAAKIDNQIVSLLCHLMLALESQLKIATNRSASFRDPYSESQRLQDFGLGRMDTFLLFGLHKPGGVIVNTPVARHVYTPKSKAGDPRKWVLGIEKADAIQVVYSPERPQGFTGEYEDRVLSNARLVRVLTVLQDEGFDQAVFREAENFYRLSPWNAAFPIATGDPELDRLYLDEWMLEPGADQHIITIRNALKDPLFQDNPRRLAERVKGVAFLFHDRILKKVCHELASRIDRSSGETPEGLDQQSR